MHHCPQPGEYCGSFWRFFEERDTTPVEYFNLGGIGEDVMRRIVYDCDRCGKREIGPVFSLLEEPFEIGSEGEPLDEDGRADLVRSRGYEAPAVIEAAFVIMEIARREKGWDHLCGGCFRRVCDGVASALGEQRPRKPKAAPKQTEEAEPEAEPEAEAAAEPKAPAKKRKPARRKAAAPDRDAGKQTTLTAA